jgi:tetratricopeptide (TPR) repeat protein
MNRKYCFLLISICTIFCFFSCKPKVETDNKQHDLVEAFSRSVLENLETVDPDSALKLAQGVIHFSDKIRNDSVLYNAYTQSAIILDNQGHYDSALYYLKEAYQMAQKNDNSEQIAWALSLICNVNISKGDYEKARENIRMAENTIIQTGNYQQLAAIYSYYGLICKKEKEFESALQYYRKAETMFDSLMDANNKAIVLGNIAEIYKNMDMHKKALSILKKIITLNDSLQNLTELTSNYNRIGLTYLHLNKYDSAIISFKRSLSLAEKTGLEFDQFIAQFNLGRAFSLNGNYIEGNELINRVYQYCIENDMPDGKVRCMLRLGQNFRELEKLEEAEDLFSQGLQISEENDYPTFIKEFLLELLLLNMDKTGKDKLKQYFFRLRQVEDSINFNKLKEKVSEFEIRYKTQKKEEQLETLKQKNQFQRLRNRYVFIIASLFLITAVLIIIFYIKRNHFLKQKNELAMKETEIQALKFKHKEQELVFLALSKARIIEKVKMLAEALRPYGSKLKTKTDQSDFDDQIKHINSLSDHDPMKEFEDHFKKLHPDFFQKLSHAYPKLTSIDLRVCAMLRLNMNTKDIASITSHTPGSIDTTRYRIRKRMNLTNDQSLVNELMKF